MLNAIIPTDSGALPKSIDVQKNTKPFKPAAGTQAADQVHIGRKPASAGTVYGPSAVTAPAGDESTRLRELLVHLFHAQGLTQKIAEDGTVSIRDMTPADARRLIGEDGYWGAAQTSDRIVQAAVAAAGRDPQRLEQIKAAVAKGFEEARRAMGGSLPDLCTETFDLAMEKLNSWASQAT